MMHKLKITGLLFIVLSFTAFSGRAQSPGYMGKKLVVGYGFYINPALSAVAYGFGNSIFNTQHEFFLEYVTSKKYMIGFSAKLYKSTYNNTAAVDLANLGNGYSGNSYPFDNRPSGTYSISARNFQLYAKLFKSNYLAPWGKYFLFGLTLNQYDCEYDPYQMQLSLQETAYSNGISTTQTVIYNNFGPLVQSYQYIDFMVGAGHSRIFANKIVLDYGYNLNAIATALVVLDAFNIETPDLFSYIKTTSTARVRGINRFNFFVKLGYLF
jgi:hypothetical protein